MESGTAQVTHIALLDALVLAKQEIRELHDRLFPDGWIIYETHSPEMRQINAALALAEKRGLGHGR